MSVPLGPLPLGPDTGSHPDIPGLGGRPYVLALGTIEHRKNLPRLVTAFGSVATALPDLCLVLAGTPGDIEQFAVLLGSGQTADELRHTIVNLFRSMLDEERRARRARHMIIPLPPAGCAKAPRARCAGCRG